MGSILVVCLAGAPASVAAEVDAGVTVFVTETASVLCLWSVEVVALFPADPSLCWFTKGVYFYCTLGFCWIMLLTTNQLTTHCWFTKGDFFLLYFRLLLDLVANKNQLNDCARFQAKVFELFA